MRSYLALFGTVLAATALAGCGTTPHAGPNRLAAPVAPTVQRGKTLFDMHCYKCHQGGEGGLAPGIRPVPRFLMRLQVRQGFGVMPAFPEEELGDAELEHILDYVVALQETGR